MKHIAFKFACYHCGQHIEGSTADFNTQVTCPGCSMALLIPAPSWTPSYHRTGRTLYERIIVWIADHLMPFERCYKFIEKHLGKWCESCHRRSRRQQYLDEKSPYSDIRWYCIHCCVNNAAALRKEQHLLEQKHQIEQERIERDRPFREAQIAAAQAGLREAKRWILPLTSKILAQRESIENWLAKHYTIPGFGRNDDANEAAATHPLPDELETLAIELRKGSRTRNRLIAETVNRLLGMRGLQAIFFRAVGQDRGLYYRLNSDFNGVGGWMV